MTRYIRHSERVAELHASISYSPPSQM